MKALRTIALAGMSLVAVTPAVAAPPGPPEQMIEKINEVRAKHGLRALREAPRLTRSADGFARHLIRSDSFSHGSGYAGTGFRRSGEILALRRGWSRKTSPALRQWMHSPGHAALILDGSFRYIGVAPARGYFGGAATTIWVARFGGP